MSTQETAMIQMQEQFASLSICREPSQVIAEAVKAAKAIQGIINAKPKKVIFNGETYVENEDWLTLARFYGVTSRTKSTNFVEFGQVHGWEATAEAYLVANNQVICMADSMCLNDEENWGMRPKYEWVDELTPDGKKIWVDKTINGVTKKMPKGEKKQIGEVAVPLFQLRSMAQTRASSKVLSMVFKWVVVLAGFRPTPAEEMDDTVINAQDVQEPQNIKRPERKKHNDPSTELKDLVTKKEPEAPKADIPRDPDCISEQQGKMLYAISKQCKLSDEEIKSKLRAEFKTKAGEPVEHSRNLQKKDFQRYIDTVDPEFKFHMKASEKDSF